MLKDKQTGGKLYLVSRTDLIQFAFFLDVEAVIDAFGLLLIVDNLSSAHDAEFFAYDNSTGNLYYNSVCYDVPNSLLATLTNHPALKASDIGYTLM